MAPPRGPRGAPSSTRQTRSSTNTLGRGGIQKRRGGGPKTDVDGDLVMDAESQRVQKSTAADPNAPRRSARTPAARGKLPSKHALDISRYLGTADSRTSSSRKPVREPLTWLKVKGLKESKAASNADGGLRELLRFLERKSSSLGGRRSSRTVAIKKHHQSGDYVMIGSSKQDAEELLKVNSFTFAGAALEILPLDAEPSPETKALKNQLQDFLSQRYVSGETKLLRLDVLSQDPTIIEMGFLENSTRAEKLFKALMRVCDELFTTRKAKKEAIESISVAGNNIDNVSQVSSLADTFPDLKNLDLSNNQIPNIQGLSAFKNRFRDLQTLYIGGNPIEAAQPEYRAHVMEWWPKLQDINGTKVRTPEEVAAAIEATKPKPIPHSGPDFRDTNGIGETFLVDFFSNYDDDRFGLVARYYDESSHFSLAVDANAPRDPDTPMPLPWAPYMKFSRNLTKITHANTRVQRLFKGRSAIAQLWKDMPATKHPDIKQDMSKYIMDCHVLPGLADPNGQDPRGVDGMIIVVHGEFDEFDADSGKTGKRSFSRTFVLGPGRPNQQPIRVVNDMVTLRAFNPLPNIFAPAAGSSSTSTAEPQRIAMVQELAKQTGMNYQYAELCLSDASVAWDFAKALAVFNEKKTQLPAEAFVTGPTGGIKA